MKPHWLTKEEIESELSTCELLFGVGGLNCKWYFVSRDFEGVKGPYNTYSECVKDCFEYLFNEPHWLSEEEIAELIIGSTSFLPLSPDPTIEMNGKWYFYDENYDRLNGPYNTRKEAQEKQEEYEDTL